MRRRIVWLAFCSLAAFLLGQAGRWSWLLDLFSHFTPEYTLCLLLGAWAAKKTWQKVFFSMAGFTLCIWILWNFWPVHQENKSPLNERRPYRFLAYNVYLNNKNQPENTQWLADSGADILFLTETTPDWQQMLQPLSAQYPHGCSHIEDSPFALILLSREALRHCEVLRLPEAGNFPHFPYIRAELADGTVLYGIHPPPPIGRELAQLRNANLRNLAALIQTETGNVIVMGDMNTTPYSVHYRHFVEIAGLRPATSGWQPTWWPALLPLDHILVRGNRPVTASGTGPWLGSDHRPVWALW